MEGFPTFDNEPETQVLEDIDALEAQDFYARLGLSSDASQDEIKQAFRSLSSKFHPDKVHSDEALRENYSEVQKRLGEAYNALSNPKEKARYDARTSYAAAQKTEASNSPTYKYDPNLWRRDSWDPAAEQRKREARSVEEQYSEYTADFAKMLDDVGAGRIDKDLMSINVSIAYAQKKYRLLGMSESEFVAGIKSPLLRLFQSYVRASNKKDETTLTYMMARLGIEPHEIDIAKATASHGYNPFR